MFRLTVISLLVVPIFGVADPSVTDESEQPDSSWEVTEAGGLVRTISHGQTLFAHQFGFVKNTERCDREFLWVVWSTGKDGLEDLTGTVVQVRFQAGSETFELGIPLISVRKVTSITTSLVLTNFVAGEKLISLIEQEEHISLIIIGPLEILDGLDIDADSFDLTGFSQAYLDSTKLCGNS